MKIAAGKKKLSVGLAERLTRLFSFRRRKAAPVETGEHGSGPETSYFSLSAAGPKVRLSRYEIARVQQLSRRPTADDVDQMEQNGLPEDLIRRCRLRLQKDLLSVEDLLLLHKARVSPRIIHQLEQLRCDQTGSADPYQS